MITGYNKLDTDEHSIDDIQKTIDAYGEYKKWFQFPQGIRGHHKSYKD